MSDRDRYRLGRRDFLAGMTVYGAAAMATGFFPEALLAQQAETKAVAEIFLDLNRIRKWDMSNGDTWDPFWADDGNLYAFNCDGRGFGAKSMNLAFNRLTGESPSNLVGAQVNQMDDYGKGGQKEADNATWKACGCLSRARVSITLHRRGRDWEVWKFIWMAKDKRALFWICRIFRCYSASWFSLDMHCRRGDLRSSWWVREMRG
jgi:hypothetical protein